MATVTKLFRSSANDIWAVLADGWLYPGWVVGASRMRAVDPEWPAPGSVLHHSAGVWPLLLNDSTRVTDSKPGQMLELIARGWPLGEARVRISLEDAIPGDAIPEDRGRCRVTMVEDAIKGPGTLIPGFLRSPLITVRNQESLKRLEMIAKGKAGSV
ncbi:SRPBCC family protein [Arthrobacter sp. ISL-30]|uniref:SRPBCC family protein n=1 Tax=Arthrobacter sp. ISL-30 TaxID=2819109 RepID=UPI001BE946B8|nr:SRPBCC family protein [Arthrobacter sp. ISL-30]MBT2513242.1 SRPBCC family protein [Arthrobacter sp. ISL-30]